LDHKSGSSPPAQGPLRDDVVQEHGVDTARHEIGVGVHVVVVRHRDDAERIAGRDQDVVGDGRAERRHAPAAQVCEA